MSESRALVVIEAKRPKYAWATDLELLEVLNGLRWHIGRAAQHFNVPRRAVAARIAESPDLQLEHKDFIDGIVDDAQDHVFAGAQKGRDIAVGTVLNALGKERGFGKQDNNAGTIEVVVRRIGQGE